MWLDRTVAETLQGNFICKIVADLVNATNDSWSKVTGATFGRLFYLDVCVTVASQQCCQINIMSFSWWRSVTYIYYISRTRCVTENFIQQNIKMLWVICWYLYNANFVLKFTRMCNLLTVTTKEAAQRIHSCASNCRCVRLLICGHIHTDVFLRFWIIVFIKLSFHIRNYR